MVTVDGDEDIMVTTNLGVMIRFSIADVSTTGRSTQGVRLIRLEDDSKVATFTKLEPMADEADVEEASQDN